MRGAHVMGGALTVIEMDPITGDEVAIPLFKTSVAYRRSLCQRLRPGWTVERHIQEGDYAIFNRQPTLYKKGIPGMRVRIHKDRTIRMPLGIAKMMNADFDGMYT